MGRAFSSQTGYADGRGVDIWVDYNDNNLRIGGLNWSLAEGVSMRVRIWEAGALVFEHSAAGPGSGSQNVTGNRSMREVTGDGDPYLDFPANITYSVQVSG